MKEYLLLMFSLIFAQNFILSRFLGLCPFVGVSKRLAAALGMGTAVVFVMTMSCAATFLFYHYVLAPFGMGDFLDIVGFILVIASLVQLVETIMKKTAPGLYASLGIYLPLITTNCAILGATQLRLADLSGQAAAGAIGAGEAFLQNTALGLFGGMGFALALFLMASIRERLEEAPVPKALQGVPIAFIAGAAMALAFYGFQGMV